jgi:ribonucleoside-triphosphate reductase
MGNLKIVIKRSGKHEKYAPKKITSEISKAYRSCKKRMPAKVSEKILGIFDSIQKEVMTVDGIHDIVENVLQQEDIDVMRAYISNRDQLKQTKNFVTKKINFINRYKGSKNTADATVDDNSNVNGKNVGILNAEIHKEDNIQVSRGMITWKLKELYPDFDEKQYIEDLENHIIYKNDESSFAGAIAPYCVSISMYPFLTNGIKQLGGLSAKPKNLDSFCGMYVNLVFAVASQYAGAVATPEVLLLFDYFSRKEWGDDYWTKTDLPTTINSNRPLTIRQKIHQHFQQIIYSINQPAASRGMQSAFVNFGYFDKPFFEGMFGDFYFPDGTKPIWESLCWLQKEFMTWFNEERSKCILTFPVESFALVYQNGEFLDKDSAEFVAQEYSRGHSFFTYISDTVDSLSSCCRLKNKIQTKEFNFTNGNIGVQTGSKSVISLNLNRITQNWVKQSNGAKSDLTGLAESLKDILERVYKYHIAYNELLWDMNDAGLLPVCRAGFINLDKQYLTIGLNGLNQAAEFLGITCNDNPEYSSFCQFIFGTIKNFNSENNGKYFGHKVTFNTECVPAESLAIKNYNWDKEDGYWVPSDTNLYASYIFKPNDPSLSVLDKLRMHGSNYIGDYLDGGSAAHINIDHHFSVEQYRKLIKYAAEQGCQYFTFNCINSECRDCGHIAKEPFDVCPVCGSSHIDHYDRIIGYITKIRNWSSGRQIEQKTRIYSKEC